MKRILFTIAFTVISMSYFGCSSSSGGTMGRNRDKDTIKEEDSIYVFKTTFDTVFVAEKPDPEDKRP